MVLTLFCLTELLHFDFVWLKQASKSFGWRSKSRLRQTGCSWTKYQLCWRNLSKTDLNTEKTQLVSFGQSNNIGAIDLKMYGSGKLKEV